MLQQNFSGDLHALVKEQAAYLMKWTNRCKELEAVAQLTGASLATGTSRKTTACFSGDVE